MFDEPFTIKGTDYENTLATDVKINQGDLLGDFESHPERFAVWSTMYDFAVDEEARLKHELERLYAKLDHAVRMEGVASNVKLTEKMVANTVITHDKYVELQEKYLDAKHTSGLLKTARDAMIHRRDMLIQLGATHRAEGASDISIRENKAKGIVGK